MHKTLFPIVAMLVSTINFAQVGINTTTPNSTLDVVKNTITPTSAKDGIIPPKVTKQELAAKLAATYSSAQTGAIVFVNNVAVPSGTTPSLSQVTQIDVVGYYYFDGTNWRKLVNATGGDSTTDAWIDNSANTRVELGITSTGAVRTTGQNVSVTDTGYLNLGYTGSPDAGIHLVGDNDGYKDDIRVDSYGGTTTGAPNIRFYSSRGTQAAAVKSEDGDNIGQFNFYTNTSATTTPDFGLPLTRITSFYKGTDKSELVFYVSGGGPAMTLNKDKNLGIGTDEPSTKLHIVSGGTAISPVSAITINDGNQGVNKVLTSNATGVGKWEDVTLKKISGITRPAGSPIQKLDGTTGLNTTNGTITFSSNHTGQLNLGSYIDLDPGKWEVEANILIDAGKPEGLNYLYNKFTFTESSDVTGSTVTKSGDLPATSTSGWLIGGALTTFGNTSGDTQQYYGIVNGKVIINNTSSAKKRYYLMYYAGIRKYSNFAYSIVAVNNASTNITIANVGSSSNGENYISAVKIQ